MPDTFSKDVKVFYPKFSKEELVENLKKSFSEISGKTRVERAMLFGSYAKKKTLLSVTSISSSLLVIIMAWIPIEYAGI